MEKSQNINKKNNEKTKLNKFKKKSNTKTQQNQNNIKQKDEIDGKNIKDLIAKENFKITKRIDNDIEEDKENERWIEVCILN